MFRKELLDARKALRSFREGVSGPESKKQRGEWEMVSTETKKHTTAEKPSACGAAGRE